MKLTIEHFEDDPQVDIFNPLTLSDEFIQTIYTIEKACFPDSHEDSATLTTWFSNPNNAIAIIKNSGKTIGFAVARPVGDIWPERILENTETVNLSTVNIAPEYQGRGLVRLLSETLENTLRTRGFKFMELNAAVTNDYAKKVERHYKERIITTSEERVTRFGLQKFFRIKI